MHAARAAVQQSICRTVTALSALLNRWTSTLRLTVESATTQPGFRSAAKLLLRERSESVLCLCSAQNPNMLVSLSVSRAVQAICAERSTSANNDGGGDGREKARTADRGTFARLCVRGRRKVCRAQLENILDVQRRSDTTFPIRAMHSTCMYSNATSAFAQIACNITVQHVQVC